MHLRHGVMAFDKETSAGFLANHLARLFAHRLQSRIARLGLAPAQFMTLLELWERDGRTQSDLTARLDVEQATMAATLKRMERDGLIARTPHPDDRRAQLIWLTDKARALEAPAKTAADAVNRDALAALTENQRAAAIGLMRKMIDAMRRD